MSNPTPPQKMQVNNMLEKNFDNLTVRRAKEAVITLPEGMAYDEAIDWMARRRDEDEREVAVNEHVDAFPLDGAMALMKAIALRFGWTSLVPTPGFWGPRPPAMIGVEVAPGQTVQVAWGRIRVPNIEGWLETGFHVDGNRVTFVINGCVKRKNERAVNELAALTRKIVREQSIYRGKAIRVAFQDPTDETFDPLKSPKFISTATNEDDLILSREVASLVKTSLFTPIEHTNECRKYGIPLKRGVLLEGPFGCGKTLAASVCAKKCVENHWTFIYLTDIEDLPQALEFAKQYAPAVIFAEDIDRITSGERDGDLDEILNTLDGIDSKHSDIICVLTTNNVEKIHKAMLRPGRLDSVISIRPPDAEAATRLVKLYAKDLLKRDEDLTMVGEKLAGQIPAVIREVVERSKLHAIGRSGDVTLEASDLLGAAEGMMLHLKLLSDNAAESEKTTLEKFAGVLGDRLAQGVAQGVAEIHKGNGVHKPSIQQ